MTRTAIVIGGGVIGVTTAAELARRGTKVTLIERAHQLGSGATARNGAQLSYSYADSLAAPAILRELPRLLAGLDPVFRVHGHRDPRLWRWALRFLGNCTSAGHVESTRDVLRLALRSRTALARLRARHAELMFKHAAVGKLHIYDSERKFAAARRLMWIKNELGCEQRALTPDQAVALEPALAKGAHDLAGAIHSPLDEAGDPYLFIEALARVAAREHGLEVIRSAAAKSFVVGARRIRALVTSHGTVEADCFVLAAGVDSSALARTASIALPICPMKGYSITLPVTADSPNVSITYTAARLVFCRLDDDVRIAGMAELGRADTSLETKRIEWLLRAARSRLPAAARWDADPRPWSGVRPMTPDSRPIIGATAVPNLFLNCGHGMLGWTLAAASAELLTDVILGDEQPIESKALARAFSISRF